MRNVNAKELRKISGGEKDVKDFYEDVVGPAISGAAGYVAGIGGGVAAGVAVYGVEGFIGAAPGAMEALEEINRLSDADVAERINNPYRYE